MDMSSPVAFYNIMMGFFALCMLFDVFFGAVTGITFAWPVCFIYYYYRRREVKGLLEEDPQEPEAEE